MATIKKAKYKQINADGSVTLFHYQTDADVVVDGASKRVPTNAEAAKWNATSSEVNSARTTSGGTTHGSLGSRLEKIEADVRPGSLLAALRTVDGSDSGLDAELVGGCRVIDTSDPSPTALWTSHRTKFELDKKLDKSEVVSAPTSNKILRLNQNGLLPAGVAGNASTATRLATARTISITGDATGSASFDGSSNVGITLNIGDNTHNHSGVSRSGPTTAENISLAGNIIDFKQAGVSKSSIDANGAFTGRAATATKLATERSIFLTGDLSGRVYFDGSANTAAAISVNSIESKKVNDGGVTDEDLWTAAKIISALGGNQITASKATDGYIKIARLIIQWGVADLSNVTSKVVTFPTPFSVHPYSITYSDTGTDFSWLVKRKPVSTNTTTEMTFVCNKSKPASLVSWIAIGR